MMPDVKFKFSESGSWYQHNTINIGLPISHKLTDDEVIEFTSDSITHEYIHHVLCHLFSETISCLFDAIGDRLRPSKLTKKVASYYGDNIELWSDGVAREGINVLINGYNLNRKRVNEILKGGC